jgi:vancomycin resistance protein YoaR
VNEPGPPTPHADDDVSAPEGPLSAPPAELAPPRPSRLGLLVVVFVASVVVGSLGHFMAVRAAARGRVLPRVSALGVSLSGLDGPALDERLSSLSSRVQALTGRLKVGDHVFDVTARDVGLVLDVAKTKQRALDVGRQGSWLRQVGWFFARPFSTASFPIAVRVDPPKIEGRLESFERAALGDPAVEGAVTYADRVVVTEPRAGLAVPRSDASSLIEQALVERRGEVVPMPARPEAPRLSLADVNAAAADAARLIGPVVLKAAEGDGQLVFPSADLGHALRSRIVDGPAPHLEAFLDRDALRVVLTRARPALEKPARDATFNVTPNHVVSLVPSELGTRLDDDAILNAVLELTRSTERTGVLAFRTDVLPALTTEDAEALHVHALVSHFTTPFPCCEARVKNIERMAALVNGSIVRPGESYSLNERSGPRTAANGFVSGPTIVEGEMEMTVGGGVSQFATTIFNAAFDGGYEIIQRQPHTYWFPRYPEGHDATLGFPLPDLVFRNDTDSAIFVKTEVGKNFVRVEFYGDNGGRRVERHVSSRFDIVKPETVLEPNPDLAADETKVKFGGWIGWSLNVSRTITYPDGHKKEERRKVTYSPRARRVETHPCHIPDGAPGYTGEKCPKIESPDGGVSR